MRLYDKPGRPHKYYDFILKGTRYRGSTGETTLKAAMKAATDYRDQLAADDPATKRTGKVPTLRQFSQTYLEYAQKSSDLDPDTVKYYQYGVRLLLFSELADVPLDQIDKKMVTITSFMRPVINRSTGKQTGEWTQCSKTYSQQALRTLRVLMGHAVEWKVINVKPKITIGKTPGRDGRITQEIEDVILRELFGYRTKRAWLVVICMMDSGARPGEVFSMRVECCDWAGRRIKILDGKTQNARRWVPMSERMHLELSTWCHGSEEPGWLFPARTSGSKLGHLNSINHSFRAACIRGGLDTKLVPYLSRHEFGTYVMRETKNAFMVANAMGHGSAEAMSPYQHQPLAPITEAINRRNAAAVAARNVQASQSS